MSDDRRDTARIVARWMRGLASSYRGGVPLEPFLANLDMRVLPGHCDYLLDSDDVRDLADFLDPTCDDVSEVNPIDGFKCSVCGWPGVVRCADCDESETNFDEIGEYVPRYCPNCGARVIRKEGAER